LDYLKAAVQILKETKWYEIESKFIPKISTWLYKRRWEDLEESDIRKKMAEMKNAAIRKAQINMQRHEQEPPQKKFCIPTDDVLPTLEKWNKMDVWQRSKIAEPYEIGLPFTEIEDGIIRREKLGNESNQTTQGGV